MLKPTAIVFLLILVYQSIFAVPYESRKLGISAASPEAVSAAKEIYQKGGNIIDAAVALSLCMSVTNPYFASLGGGGFAMIKMGEEVSALDFREVAPAALLDSTFESNSDKQASITGGLAIGVPGIPMGLWEMHKKYGKLPWPSLFAPAIRAAERGVNIHSDFAKRVDENISRFNKSGQMLFKVNDKNLSLGDNLKQYSLAQALKLLKFRGVREFYEGKIAKDISDTVKKNGGVLELSDLKKYKAIWRKPMSLDFESNKIYLMPPPSSGGVVISTALRLIDKLQLKENSPYSIKELHLLIEILSRSFRSRSLLADPDFYQNPTEKLLSEDYIDKLSKTISSYKSLELKPLEEKDYIEKKESTETTHFSLVDEKGNAVSMTVTLNGSFGSGVFSDKYSINLNNEIDDFTTQRSTPNMFGLIQGSGNKIEAGKRPLSSMSPTIITNSNDRVIALGSPGGPRIISSVLQVIYRHLVNGFDIDQAIQAPRFHHQFLPHKVYYEKVKSFPDTIEALSRKGHDFEDSWAGRVYAVSKEKEKIFSAYDARLPGAASGL